VLDWFLRLVCAVRVGTFGDDGQRANDASYLEDRFALTSPVISKS
jgi:hypothetical protein